MKIGFLSVHDPLNRFSFSGTTFYMYKALEGQPGVSLSVIGERFHRKTDVLETLMYYIEKLSFKKISLQKAIEKRRLNRYKRRVIQELSDQSAHYDAIVAPVASKIIGELPESLYRYPFIFITDATPKFIQEEYNWEVAPEHFSAESRTIERSKVSVFSSDYMAERARTEYQREIENTGAHIVAIPFGLNMDLIPVEHEFSKAPNTINLLFVGREWQRKGGPKAVDAIKCLRERGHNCHLTIVGCDPKVSHPDITVIPFLNKNVPAEQEKYLQLLKSSHFLILPTLADCTPMVIAEANAFGTPALVADVGGISTLLETNKNGVLMAPEANGEAYAKAAIEQTQNYDTYKKLCESSRNRYETILNWNAWASSILALVSTMKQS